MRSLSSRLSVTPSALLIATALLGGCAMGAHHAMAQPADVMTQSGMLTGANGMALYTFDKDMANSGKSACNGPCATNWPPLITQGGAMPEGYTVVMRDDGNKQVAYKGKPLYFWIKDKQPGDKTGDGFNGVWHLATP